MQFGRDSRNKRLSGLKPFWWLVCYCSALKSGVSESIFISCNDYTNSAFQGGGKELASLPALAMNGFTFLCNGYLRNMQLSGTEALLVVELLLLRFKKRS